MGARGLGQLAYNKGMRILAASQADDVALESSLVQQGLLSYALVNDGLEQRRADHKPQDRKITLAEWLGYGVERVPGLADEVRRGTLGISRGNGSGTAQRSPVSLSGGASLMRGSIQQPSLFDFTKQRRDVTLVESPVEGRAP